MVNQNAIVSPGGGGGAGREIMYKQVSVSGGTTIPVTVGAGGLGGVSGLIVYKGSLSPEEITVLMEESPLLAVLFLRLAWRRKNWLCIK